LAGKLAMRGELTEESTSEQASADLGNCTAEEYEAFQSLNDRYKEKFGFPFILAVRGYHRTEILEIFKQRVDNDAEIEFDEALTQIHRIARLRLNEIE
jgi:OHCU decarboxylase